MSRKRRPDPLAHLRHPIGAAILKKKVEQQIRAMQTDAMLHILIGANDAALINEAGRLAYIAAEATRLSREPEDSPDMKIVAGMANALADLAARSGPPELHRLAIQSGLLAIERLLPRCNVWSIAKAHLQVEEILASAEGLTIFHITKPKEIQP